MNAGGEMARVMRRILKDISVDLGQEFDQNFSRQAFFSSAWARHKKGSPYEGGHILLKSGQLRRSIRSKADANSITFSSDLAYAAIHNNGGKIRVTSRMKKFFWAKYYAATGGFTRKKDGSLSGSKKQKHLSAEAEFWKAMALMRVGAEITIPQRKFLGTSPEVEGAVKKIISDNITEYLNTLLDEAKKVAK